MKTQDYSAIILPPVSAADRRVLLHSCCAPCSAAILECMLSLGLEPTVFYSNSNIFPEEEYRHRLEELRRHCALLKIPLVEDNYDHAEWLQYVKGLENEPERGSRCMQCFRFRLLRVAKWGKSHDFQLFTTTLASSRWKNLEQINSAAQWAESQLPPGSRITFWDQNWRRHGLQPRRNELIKQFQFYNQQYCGCEFSMHHEKQPQEDHK